MQQMQMEAEMQRQDEEQMQQNIIREGEQAQEDEAPGMMAQMDEQPDFDGRGGALVEEAKRLMKEDQEEDQQPVNNEGPKIKMNRIGRRNKKTNPGAKADEPGAKKSSAAADYIKAPEKQGTGFNEKDIEFMKKAI